MAFRPSCRAALEGKYSARRAKFDSELRRQHNERHSSGKPYHLAGTLRTNAYVFSIEHLHQLRGLHFGERISCVYGASQFVNQLQVFCLLTVGQITGEPYAVKSFRENMLEKHPDEVAAFYSEKFLFSAVSVIFVPERDMRICDFCDPAVGDCSSEGIPRKVTDCVSLAVKRLFDEGQPPFLKQAINKSLKKGGICQFPGMGKIEFVFLIQLP